nr:RluA family pseudouridine synthase [Pseudozobellia thermophila]
MGLFRAAFTKSALKKALKKDYVTVNGVLATSGTFIRGGEHIELSIPPKAGPKKKLIFPLRVLFEDDYLAVVHKPAGILVSGNSFKTVAKALEGNLRPSGHVDATIPWPVHRLDYATTGILLIGKTSSSIRNLNRMFEDKAIKKTYYAVTIGSMERSGQINAAVDGKASQSEYTQVRSVASERFGQLNLVRLEPRTGRRHQLRQHLSGIGNPILGDQIYGPDNLILRGKGLYLHAHSLQFEHPLAPGEPVELKAPLPLRFTKLFGDDIVWCFFFILLF